VAENDEEKIGRLLRSFLSQRRRGEERAGCPDEESMAGYLGGNLQGKVKEQLEAHLSGCSFCADELVAAYQAIEETGEQTETGKEKETGTGTGTETESGKIGTGRETVPKQLIERAMALVRPSKGAEEFFDLAVRLASDFAELVSTSGQRVKPPGMLPVTRAGVKSSEVNFIKVQKIIGKYKVTVEVEHVDTGLCEVVVGIEEEEGQPAEGLRVGLNSGKREQASYLTQQGRAVFERIPRGEYNLPVSESGTPLGVIRLSID